MLQQILFILIVSVIFLMLAGLFVVVGSALVVRFGVDAQPYSGGFEDDNADTHYKIIEHNSDMPALPSTVVIVDPRNKSYIEYHDAFIKKDIRIQFRQCYAPPSSKKQISTLFHKSDSSVKARLAQLLGMVPGIDPWDRRIYRMSDTEIYRKIRPRDAPPDPGRALKHAASIYRLLARTLKAAMPATPAYLDIGCMDGSITGELARLMGAPEPKCIEPTPRGQTAGVEIITKVDRYPFEDGQFDIITAIMSLHHIPSLDPVIAEMIRVLKPGGYIFIKEHDAWTPSDCALIDIEHALHMTISGEIEPGQLPPADYYIQYRNYVAFDALFSTLRFIKSNYFHATERHSVSPTRAYWAIYQKPLA